MKTLPRNKPVLLDNETCPYCGVCLDWKNSTKEHVVGRRFVPKGKFDGSWNLIVRACRNCNCRKSDLENDLSAVTMQPDSAGQFAREDQVLVDEAARKAAESISRRTRKPVSESSEVIKIRSSPLPGVNLTFTLTASPQVDDSRAFELARLQISGFFYRITFNRERRRGGFWPGGFHAVNLAPRSDWGNPVQRAFMSAVVEWESRMLGVAADGYFKAAIRQHPEDVCWSWALEWNESLRLIGFFGEQACAERVLHRFPENNGSVIGQRGGNRLRFRSEVCLPPEDDILFSAEPG
jgi:hypothetical protein